MKNEISYYVEHPEDAKRLALDMLKDGWEKEMIVDYFWGLTGNIFLAAIIKEFIKES